MTLRPHMLKGLQVDEISLVDAPANPGAFHILFKRGGQPMPTPAELEIARKKAATPGPLERLLVKLGITKSAETVDPETFVAAATSAFDQARIALGKSIDSIIADAAVTDKAAAIAKSMEEFKTFTDDTVGDQIEKAMRAVALLKAGKDDAPMPTEAEQIAALTKQLADKEAELALAKAADPAAAAAAAKKKKEDDEAAAMKKRLEAAGGSVELTKALGQIETLQKTVAGFEAEREMATFRKRAADIGVAEAQAEVIMKASKGDEKSFAAVLDMLKSATTAARTGGVFKEFGGAGGAGAGGAKGEVDAAAEVMRKANPALSIFQARAAVRKSDLDLAQRERDEERAAARLHAV